MTSWNAASGGYAHNARLTPGGGQKVKWQKPVSYEKWAKSVGKWIDPKDQEAGMSVAGLAKNIGGDIGDFIGGIPGMVQLGWNVATGLGGTVFTGGRHEGSKKKLKGSGDAIAAGVAQSGKDWWDVGRAIATAGNYGDIKPLYEDPVYMLLDAATVASGGSLGAVKGASVANKAAKGVKSSDKPLARRLRAATRTRQLKDAPEELYPNVPGLNARLPGVEKVDGKPQVLDPDVPFRTHDWGTTRTLAELARSDGRTGGTRQAGQILKDIAPDTPRSVIDKVILNTNWAGFKTPGGATAALATYSPFRAGAVQEITDQEQLGKLAQLRDQAGKFDDPSNDLELGPVAVQQRRLSRGPIRRGIQRGFRSQASPRLQALGQKSWMPESVRRNSDPLYRGQKRAAKYATREITEAVGTELARAGGPGAALAASRVFRDKEIQLVGARMLDAVITSADPKVIREQLRPLLELYRKNSKSTEIPSSKARKAQDKRIEMLEGLLDENHPLWSDKKRMQRLVDYVNYQRTMAKELELRGLSDPRFSMLDPSDLAEASWRNVFREVKTAPARIVRGGASYLPLAGPSGRVVNKEEFERLAGTGVSNVESLFQEGASNSRVIAQLTTRVNGKRTKAADSEETARVGKSVEKVTRSNRRTGSIDADVIGSVISNLFNDAQARAFASASSGNKVGGNRIDADEVVRQIAASSSGTLDDLAAARAINEVAAQISKQWYVSPSDSTRLVNKANGTTLSVEEVISRTYIGGGKERVALRRMERDSKDGSVMAGELVWFSPTTNTYVPVRNVYDTKNIRDDILKRMQDKDKRKELSKIFSASDAKQVNSFWDDITGGESNYQYIEVNAANTVEAMARIDVELRSLTRGASPQDLVLGERNSYDMLQIAKLALRNQTTEKNPPALRLFSEIKMDVRRQTVDALATDYLAQTTRPILLNADTAHKFGAFDPYVTADMAGTNHFVDWDSVTKQFDQLRKNGNDEAFKELYDLWNSDEILGAVDAMEDAIYIQHRVGYDDKGTKIIAREQGGAGTRPGAVQSNAYTLFAQGLEDVGVTSLLRQMDITIRNAGQASLMGQVFATHALRDAAGRVMIFYGDHGSHNRIINPEKYTKVSLKEIKELKAFIDRDSSVNRLRSSLVDDNPESISDLARFLDDTGNSARTVRIDDNEFVARTNGYKNEDQYVYVDAAMWDEVWQLKENAARVGWPKALQKYDSFLSMWRRGILGLAPRWVVNNLLGNTFFYGVATLGDWKSFRLASTGAIPRRERFGNNAQRRQTEAGFGDDGPGSGELWTDADIEARFNMREAVANGDRPNAALGYSARENIAGSYSYGIEGAGYSTQGLMGHTPGSGKWADDAFTGSNDPLYYSGVETSARSQGAKTGGVVKTAFGVPSRVFNATTNKAQRINQNLEATFRRALYIHFARKYLKEMGTAKEINRLSRDKQWDSQRTDYELLQAIQNIPDSSKRLIMQDMRNWIGDYGNLSAFERNVMRRVIPFYSWLRVINTWAFGLPFRSPIRAELLATAAQIAIEVRGDRKHLPWWERNRIELGGGLSLRTAGMNPLESIYEPTQALLGEPDFASKLGATGRWAMGSSSPLAQETIKYMTGYDTFSGQDLTSPANRNDRITPYGRDPMYLNDVTGDLDSNKPFSSPGVAVENLMPGVSAIAPVVRDIVSAGKRPYDVTPTSSLIANAIGLPQYTDDNNFYQPPRDISRGSGRKPLAPGATRFLSLLGLPIQRYDPEQERISSSARISELIQSGYSQRRLLAKQRTKRGIPSSTKAPGLNYSR